MNDRIKKYLDDVFQKYDNTESIRILKEELHNNMQEKFDDLVRDGLDEESAYQRTINDLGDISEIIENVTDKTGESSKKDKEESYTHYKTFEVSQGGLLNLDTNQGSIEIKGSETDKVEIKVFCKETDFFVNFDKRGNDVHVRGIFQGGIPMWIKYNPLSSWANIRYVISVPKNYNLNLKTMGGKITVNDLKGDIHSNTSGGDLYFSNVSGQIFANTSVGSITIQKCNGKVHSKTMAGSILINDHNGDIHAHTIGGSINIQNINGRINTNTIGGNINAHNITGSINANTTGGSIETGFVRQPDSDCRLNTMAGSIMICLPDEAAVDITAETMGGNITSDFNLKTESGNGFFGKTFVKDRIKNGGPMMMLKTSWGNIQIKKVH
jgi:hypothetical protein